ncbi:MSHA biogenesis protein MshO [Shewanella putrefaciens]|nr:MSHA biogenesis protein MshO [Shewanella putrefaciens]
MLSQSRFVVERMTRELRSAVPNSVRVNTDSLTYQCIEFVPIQASTSYYLCQYRRAPQLSRER